LKNNQESDRAFATVPIWQRILLYVILSALGALILYLFFSFYDGRGAGRVDAVIIPLLDLASPEGWGLIGFGVNLIGFLVVDRYILRRE